MSDQQWGDLMTLDDYVTPQTTPPTRRRKRGGAKHRKAGERPEERPDRAEAAEPVEVQAEGEAEQTDRDSSSTGSEAAWLSLVLRDAAAKKQLWQDCLVSKTSGTAAEAPVGRLVTLVDAAWLRGDGLLRRSDSAARSTAAKVKLALQDPEAAKTQLQRTVVVVSSGTRVECLAPRVVQLTDLLYNQAGRLLQLSAVQQAQQSAQRLHIFRPLRQVQAQALAWRSREDISGMLTTASATVHLRVQQCAEQVPVEKLAVACKAEVGRAVGLQRKSVEYVCDKLAAGAVTVLGEEKSTALTAVAIEKSSQLRSTAQATVDKLRFVLLPAKGA